MKHAFLHLIWLAGLASIVALGSQEEPSGAPGRMLAPGSALQFGTLPAAPLKPFLPAAALEVATLHDKEVAELRKESVKKMRALRLRLAAALKDFQDIYTREEKFEEAAAIRDFIRMLRCLDVKARPDPGSLSQFNNFVGRVGYFKVTGSSSGSIYGTGIYTSDSSLATAAVHAGALRIGQTGVVKVTMVAGCDAYEASTRNGITSSGWGNYHSSFKVEPVPLEDETEFEDQSDLPLFPSSAPPPGFQADSASNLSATGLPEDARQLVERFQPDIARLQKEAEEKIKGVQRELILQLKPLMTNYARQVKLDEAVAVRDYIREIAASMMNVLPDPGALYYYRAEGRNPLYFRVTGRGSGSIYGTDIYTADSSLATAAVHAGVVKDGQCSVVKVTMLPGQDHYEGTTRNGITSNSWGAYSSSYKVEAIPEEELLNWPESTR